MAITKFSFGRQSLAVLVALSLSAQAARADLPQPGDFAFGLSQSDATKSIELVRGPATMGGGVKLTSPWQTTPFIEIVKFDNLGGIAHNVHGNLLGVDFGTAAAGGQIFSFATKGADPAPAGQLIADTNAAAPVGGAVTQTRLGILAVSPDNTKVAITGYDAGDLIGYNYTAGDSMGGGASLSAAHESSTFLDPSHTEGAVFKDNSTIITMSSLGIIYESDFATLTPTMKTTLDTPAGVMANFTSLAYNPAVSPYLYALWGGFVSPATTNNLFVLDPASNYSVVKKIDLSTSINTARDMALDKNGNLFMSQFGGTGSPAREDRLHPRGQRPKPSHPDRQFVA